MALTVDKQRCCSPSKSLLKPQPYFGSNMEYDKLNLGTMYAGRSRRGHLSLRVDVVES